MAPAAYVRPLATKVRMVKVRLGTVEPKAFETTQVPAVPVVHDLEVPSLREKLTLTLLSGVCAAVWTTAVTVAVHLVRRAFQLVEESRSATWIAFDVGAACTVTVTVSIAVACPSETLRVNV